MSGFDVTAVWDKASYAAGEAMKVTVSGRYAGSAPATVGPFSVPVVSASGAQSVVEVPPITVTVGTDEPVLIDTTRAIVDPSGRTWVVSADRKSITATA